MGAPAAPARQRTGPGVIILRFLAGMHLDGRRRSDATFFARGTEGIGGYWSGGRASRWAMLAGWQRSAIRLAAAALAVGLVRWPHATGWVLALAGGPALGAAAWRSYVAMRLRRHRREVVIPLYAVLSSYLGTPAEERPELYLSVPVAWDRDPDAVVRITYPAGWDPQPALRDRIEEAISRHLPGSWDVRWGKAWATWKRAPLPPGEVTFADMREDFEAGPEHLIPVGRTTRGQTVRIDLDGDAPHLAYSGGTGAGKTTFLRGVIAYLIRHGAEEVIICDPKRISLSKPFRDVPNVRIIRDSADWPAAIAYVKDRMMQRYRWAESQPDPEAAIAGFRRLVLVIEEGGSLADMLRDDWRAVRSREDPAEPPALTDLRHIGFQGRQGKVTLLWVVQQGNAKDTGGSALRDQFAGRIMVRYQAAAWRMLVGTFPIPRAPKHRGRGYVVIGDEEQLVQLVNISSEEAEALALEADPAPAAEPEADVPSWPPAAADPGPDLAVVPPPGPDAGAGTVTPLRVVPRYLSQADVAAHLGMSVMAFAKWRQRCRQAGRPLPEPEYFSGRPGWTDEQLEDIAERRNGRAEMRS